MLRLQQAYDLWHAERALKKEIAKISDRQGEGGVAPA
jgi:plasmid maintenance system antidote protein VapI